MTRRVLLDRDLDVAWLDAALGHAVRGTGLGEARADLAARVRSAGYGQTAAAKTVTALSRTWLTPPPGVGPVIGWAVRRSPVAADARPLHIGALLCTQPFFADQAAVVGRILAVQPDVETPVVRQRMRAAWGERRSVDISAQRTIKTMRSLGMLQGPKASSTSRAGAPIPVDAAVAAWLARCLMAARGADSIAVTELASAPELAWFELPRAVDAAAAGLLRHAEGAGRTVLAVGAVG